MSMETYDVETFQKKVLEDYFNEHAPLGVRTRRETKKMTMEGAYKWMMSKLQRLRLDSECVVTDDDWAYNEMMAYFTECEEGDEYRTEEEIEKEKKEALERKEADKKNREARLVKLRAEHAERVKRWAGMNSIQIECDIYRRKHQWHKDKTDDEIICLLEDEERKERERQEKEDARKEKEEKKKAKEEAKKKYDEMMEKWKSQQLSFDF